MLLAFEQPSPDGRYILQPVVSGGDARLANQYAASVMPGSGEKAILVGDVVADENRMACFGFRSGKETVYGRALPGIAGTELEHHLAMLQIEAGFGGKPFANGPAFFFPYRSQTVMQRDTESLFLYQQATSAIGKADELCLGFVDLAGTERGFRRTAGIGHFQTVTAGEDEIPKIERTAQTGDRAAAHNGQPAPQPVADTGKKKAKRLIDQHVARSWRQIDQRSVKIEEEESILQKGARRRRKDGGGFLGHPGNLEQHRMKASSVQRFRRPLWRLVSTSNHRRSTPSPSFESAAIPIADE